MIPLIITIILFLLQIYIFNEITEGYNKIKNTDYVCYGSVYLTFIILIIILILVSISVYYALKSSYIINQTKKNFY